MTQMAGPDPIWTNCPNCNQEILTTPQKSISTFQMLVAGLKMQIGSMFWYRWFLSGWTIWKEFREWKDVLHTCPNCNYGIGKFK